jgi:hypothetical protein
LEARQRRINLKTANKWLGASYLSIGCLLVSCSHQKAATPIRIEEQLLRLIANTQIATHRLEADCIRRQGVSEIFRSPKITQVLNIESVESGASVLARKSDDELIYLRTLLRNESPPMSPDMRSARFEAITINGRKVPGGCSLWAVNEARQTIKNLDLAMSVQEKMQRAIGSNNQALSPVKYRWLKCLTGESKKIAKTRKIEGPGEFRLAFGGDSLLVLRRSADLEKARVALRLLGAQQVDVLAEVERCETKVNYLEEFQRVRNKSIAQVLNGLDAQSQLQLKQLSS